MLRGMVEELNYELQQIKQRQMDDYLDIDRRLSAHCIGQCRQSSDCSASGGRQRPMTEVGAAPVMPA